MKYYTHEITGKQKELCEDASFSKLYFHPSRGEPVGLFMVADGLSGYSGRTASRMATECLAEKLEKQIRTKKWHKLESSLKEATLAAHNLLAERGNTYTTLDLALVLEKQVYTVHLGDGRIYFFDISGNLQQISKDELASGMPGNYLGREILGGKSIQDRINILKYPRRDDLAGIILATDGLSSRVPEPALRDTIAMLGSKKTPGEILEIFDAMIHYPREMLLQLDEQLLRRNMFSGLGRYTSLPTKEELVESVLKSYAQGEDQELIQRLDGGLDSGTLKADDTTIIMVDLLERDATAFAEVLQKREKVMELEARVDEFSSMLRRKEEDYAASCTETEQWKNKYAAEKQGRETAETMAATLAGDLAKEKADLEELGALIKERNARESRTTSSKDPGNSIYQMAITALGNFKNSIREAFGGKK